MKPVRTAIASPAPLPPRAARSAPATTPRSRDGAGRAVNEQVTSLDGALLVVLLAAIGVTVARPRQLDQAHFLLGFVLLPPVFLKLASTGYRFVRYYGGDPRYREAGPPPLLLRLLGPVVVVSTVVLFATGIELWLFGTRFGTLWHSAHLLSFVVWFPAMTVHVLGHARQSWRAVTSEVTSSPGPARMGLTPRSLAIGCLVLGVVLAAVSLAYHSPFVSFD